MRIYVSLRLYNSYGGHKSISLAGELLEYDFPALGGAINEIEITLNFFHAGPARKTLESMQDEFHEGLKSLPKCTFFRKKQRLCLDFEATFTTGYQIELQKKPPILINPEWVRATLVEIINQLPIIKSKIRKTDDFDYDKLGFFALKYGLSLDTSESLATPGLQTKYRFQNSPAENAQVLEYQ